MQTTLPGKTLAAIFLFLALFGGMQFYLLPGATLALTGAGLGLVILIPVLWRGTPPLALPGLIYLIAMLFSTAANPDILAVAASRLILASIALTALVTAHQINATCLLRGLYLAGWLWPGVWLAARGAGWADNPNVVAAWSVVFIAVSLTGHNWWHLLLNLGVLCWLGSRGAIIGATVAVLVMVWTGTRPRLDTKTYPVLGLAGLAGLAGLIAWDPRLSMIRLYYWQRALAAFYHNPIFGVGPGGLKALNFIPEWGGGFQIHAHNIIITTGAELGLVGLVALALIAWWLYAVRHTLKPQRWQLAIMAGLLAHSMVDEPLWWPGPLLVFAMIAGAVRN
jgi:O-antigen ligase